MGASSKKVVVLVGGCDVDSEYSKSGLMFQLFLLDFSILLDSLLDPLGGSTASGSVASGGQV